MTYHTREELRKANHFARMAQLRNPEKTIDQLQARIRMHVEEAIRFEDFAKWIIRHEATLTVEEIAARAGELFE